MYGQQKNGYAQTYLVGFVLTVMFSLLAVWAFDEHKWKIATVSALIALWSLHGIHSLNREYKRKQEAEKP